MFSGMSQCSIFYRPTTAKELFNLRHSQARNIVERQFGVAKREFAMMREPNEFPIHYQAPIQIALCTLHNFNTIHGGQENVNIGSGSGAEMQGAGGDIEDVGAGGISAAETERACAWRDAIAEAMWASYVAERAARGQPI